MTQFDPVPPNGEAFQRLVEYYNTIEFPIGDKAPFDTFLVEARSSPVFLEWQIYIAIAPLLFPERYKVENFSLVESKRALYANARTYFAERESAFDPEAEYNPQSYVPLAYAKCSQRAYLVRAFVDLCRCVSPSLISVMHDNYQVIMSLVLEVQKAQLSVPSKLKDSDSTIDLIFRRNLTLDVSDLGLASHILSLPHCPHSVYERTVSMFKEDDALSLDDYTLRRVWDKLSAPLLINPSVPIVILEDFLSTLDASRERLGAAVGDHNIASLLVLFTSVLNLRVMYKSPCE